MFSCLNSVRASFKLNAVHLGCLPPVRAKAAKAAAREWERKKFEADVQTELYHRRVRDEALDRMFEEHKKGRKDDI